MQHNTYMDDIENLKFDKQEFLWEQFDEYLTKNVITSKECRILRKWVSDGHSVYENSGSRYLMESYPPQDFLDAYRENKKIERFLRGKTEKEKEIYLKKYMGYEEIEEKPSLTPDKVKKHVKKLEHELFYLWEYVNSQDLWSETKEYLEEHDDDTIPFGYLD